MNKNKKIYKEFPADFKGKKDVNAAVADIRKHTNFVILIRESEIKIATKNDSINNENKIFYKDLFPCKEFL